jgi:hypothetical protein
VRITDAWKWTSAWHKFNSGNLVPISDSSHRAISQLDFSISRRCTAHSRSFILGTDGAKMCAQGCCFPRRNEIFIGLNCITAQKTIILAAHTNVSFIAEVSGIHTALLLQASIRETGPLLISQIFKIYWPKQYSLYSPYQYDLSCYGFKKCFLCLTY